MEIKKHPRILVAPLDWGLGHATRCIPIINQLLNADFEIIIASSGQSKHLLEQEFPGLRIVDIPGYKVNFSKKNSLNLAKIISQIPKMLIQIKREKKWLNDFIIREKPDGLISDNRYGLHSKRVFSVFITHQLYFKTPFGKTISSLLSGLNYRFINRFSVCWVPDFTDGLSLSGKLGHPKILPKIPIKYVGSLSRFKRRNEGPMLYDFITILSGPEPQRSIFEAIVFSQLRNYRGPVLVVRGLPDQTGVPVLSSNILIHNHLSSVELNKVICQSELIISRSGYSTIMDVVALGKKSIMVPTPGQPEQQYLAEYLFEKKIVYRVKQDEFILEKCLDSVKTFPFVSFNISDSNPLSNAISELMNKIEERRDLRR